MYSVPKIAPKLPGKHDVNISGGLQKKRGMSFLPRQERLKVLDWGTFGGKFFLISDPFIGGGGGKLFNVPKEFKGLL